MRINVRKQAQKLEKVAALSVKKLGSNGALKREDKGGRWSPRLKKVAARSVKKPKDSSMDVKIQKWSYIKCENDHCWKTMGQMDLRMKCVGSQWGLKTERVVVSPSVKVCETV